MLHLGLVTGSKHRLAYLSTQQDIKKDVVKQLFTSPSLEALFNAVLLLDTVELPTAANSLLERQKLSSVDCTDITFLFDEVEEFEALSKMLVEILLIRMVVGTGVYVCQCRLNQRRPKIHVQVGQVIEFMTKMITTAWQDFHLVGDIQPYIYLWKISLKWI